MDKLDKSKLSFVKSFVFVIALFTCAAAISMGLYMSINERVKDINEFNKRAKIWNEDGYKSFKEASFEFCVNGDCFTPELVEKASGDLYPVNDKCNKDGDPAEGCAKTEVAYFSYPVKSVQGLTEISLMNDAGVTIVNRTVNLSKKQYLKSGYVLDVPPEWTLNKNNNDTGCYYSNGWDALEYSNKRVESTAFQVRSYQDPFIVASSLTRGCNEIEKNSWCFGISEKEMKTYGMYGLIVSGSGLIITLIVFVIAFAVHKRKNSSSIEELIN